MSIPSKIVPKLLRTIGPFTHTHGVATALSPDGRHIAVHEASGPLRIQDTRTGEILQEIRGEGGAWDVRFSPDGKLLAVSFGPPNGAQILFLYRTADWQEEWRYGDESFWVQASASSPDGKRFAAISDRMKNARVLDVATGRKLYECVIESKCWGRNVVFSPDGKHLMSTYREENPHLWDAETGKLIRKTVVTTDLKLIGTVPAAFLSNEEVIFNWRHNEGSPIINLRNNARRGWPGGFLALSADRRIAAIRSVEGALTFHSPASGEVLAETQELLDPIYPYSYFSADGNVFATLDRERRVKIWELQFTAPDTEEPTSSDGTVTDDTAASAEAPE